MASYILKMSILVPNKNQCGQKDLSFKVRHKAYASRWQPFKIKNI
jgi:hypothetical protein